MRHAGRATRILACMLVLCACSRGVRSPNQAQSPSPSAPTVASPQPTATATPSPNVITPTPGTPGPSATTTPHASAPPIAKKVPRIAPDAAPEILGISMTETTVKPGDTVSGRVLTSSNVASVEARIGGYAMSLSKVGVGRFELIYKVAPLPWFVRGNFTMQVIARNTRGDTATRAIPLTVRQ